MECKLWLLTSLAVRQPLAQLAPAMLRSRSESCVPILLLQHLLSALPSTTAHRARAPQGNAFCRQPDGIICSVGVKLIMTAGTEEWSYPWHSAACAAGCVPGQASACAQDTKARWQSPGAALCRVMLPWHLHSAARPLPGHTSSGHLWPSNRDCQQQGDPWSFQCSWVKYLKWTQSRALSV